MAKKTRSLGRDVNLARGVDALFPKNPEGNAPEWSQKNYPDGPARVPERGILEIEMEEIEAVSGQPRSSFDQKSIEELAESIRHYGILQPILVSKLDPSPTGKKYRIIAGERRFRACKKLEIPRIPAIVQGFEEVENFAVSLVENIQREDLNPIDEANAYQKLLELSGLNQSELAQRLGKSRPVLANSLRLLGLPQKVQEGLRSGALRPGHGRILLMLEDPENQELLYERILAESLSVREVESICRKWAEEKSAFSAGKDGKEGFAPEEDRDRDSAGPPRWWYQGGSFSGKELEEVLKKSLGGSVAVTVKKQRLEGENWQPIEGEFRIGFDSFGQWEALLECLGFSPGKENLQDALPRLGSISPSIPGIEEGLD